MIKALLILMLLCGEAWATDYCASAVGCFLMEDATTETDRSTGYINDLSVSSGDTIPQSTDKKFGDYSRGSFNYSDAEYLYHADGLSTDINGSSARISIVSWGKTTYDGGDGNQSLVSKYNSGGSERQYNLLMMMNITNDPAWFLLSSNATAGITCAGATNLETDTWYHIAGVYDGTDMRLYVNGRLDSNGSDNPKSHTAGIYNSNTQFRVGGDYSGFNYMRGYIDDVGIFNTALSSTDISAIYDYGLSPTGSVINYPSVLNDSFWNDTYFN
jgi:hypothetical protein